jgi:hypothetical protein
MRSQSWNKYKSPESEMLASLLQLISYYDTILYTGFDPPISLTAQPIQNPT